MRKPAIGDKVTTEYGPGIITRITDHRNPLYTVKILPVFGEIVSEAQLAAFYAGSVRVMKRKEFELEEERKWKI